MEEYASHRSSPVLVTALSVLVIGGLAGGVLAVDRVPALHEFFFGESNSWSFNVTGQQLAVIIDEIRASKRKKWGEMLEQLNDIERRFNVEFREPLLLQVKTQIGDSYLQEFLQLSKDLHNEGAPIPLDKDSGLDRIFEAAKQVEKKLTNDYRDIRGALNSLRLNCPPVDAIGWVKMVQPQRISLEPKELNAEILTMLDGKLDAFKAQINRGNSSMDAMISHARNMLDNVVQGMAGAADATIDIVAAGGGGSAQGETLMPDELWLDADGATDGGFGATPGKVVHNGGRDNAWMFLDTWYWLGPFENRFRCNLDSSFLPETVIDLDNVTIGKDNKEIRWEWRPALPQRLEPDWAPRGCIYYGWTQIRMPKKGKYWVALGSDDYGKMWVNNDLKWKSSTHPKPYSADEWVGEIEFEEGVNDVLFRCENHGGTMGWSVVIATTTEAGG